MRVISNKQDIINRISRSFEATVQRYDEAMKEIIANPRQWGDFGTTYRRNGEIIVGGFRNIVDLENLQNSQRFEMVNPFLARFTWDGNGKTPVTLVHEGYTTKTGKTIPARPWTTYGIIEGELEKTFINTFKQ